MAVLAAPSNYTSGQQVTHTNLNAHVNDATFASGAVDNSTTQLSGGAIIVKDSGITTAKLADAAVTTAKLSSTTGTGDVVLATSPTLVTPVLGAATGTSVTVSGNLRSTGATSGVGYSAGAGGSVTQGAGSGKSTGVTLNKVCGQITMNNATLADGAIAGFILTNSNIAVTDVIILSMNSSGISTGSYQYWVDTVGLGTCYIYVRNVSGSDKSEAIVLNFAIIKSAIT